MPILQQIFSSEIFGDNAFRARLKAEIRFLKSLPVYDGIQ